MSAPGRVYACAKEQRGEQCRSGETELMPSQELAGSIHNGIPAGHDRTTIQVALQLLAEQIHGPVPAARILAKRHHQDIVQIADQAFTKSLDGGIPRPTDFNVFAARTRARRTRDDGTRSGCIALADDPCRFFPVEGLDSIGPHARKQLVKNDAQGVDIAAYSDGFSSNLLRTRIRGSSHADHGHDPKITVLTVRWIEKLGNSKVKQLRYAVLCHQYVVRLEIPMHN